LRAGSLCAVGPFFFDACSCRPRLKASRQGTPGRCRAARQATVRGSVQAASSGRGASGTSFAYSSVAVPSAAAMAVAELQHVDDRLRASQSARPLMTSRKTSALQPLRAAAATPRLAIRLRSEGQRLLLKGFLSAFVILLAASNANAA
jgi:hypothetical protein